MTEEENYLQAAARRAISIITLVSDDTNYDVNSDDVLELLGDTYDEEAETVCALVGIITGIAERLYPGKSKALIQNMALKIDEIKTRDLFD